MPPSPARRRCSTPATTGTRSSCTAPRRWPMSSGRTSASARPTTSSPPAAPAPTCSAARSAFPNCCAPARSTALPRIFAAQPANCAPIAAAFLAGADGAGADRRSPDDRGRHRHRAPVRLREVLGALRETRGGAVRLTEAEIGAATLELARTGHLCRADLRAGARRLRQAAGDRDDHAGSDHGIGDDRNRPESDAAHRRAAGRHAVILPANRDGLRC